MHNLPLLVFNKVFKFLDYVCKGCHDLTMFCLKISDITIITVKNIDYRSIIHNIFYPFYLVYIKWLILWTSISL